MAHQSDREISFWYWYHYNDAEGSAKEWCTVSKTEWYRDSDSKVQPPITQNVNVWNEAADYWCHSIGTLFRDSWSGRTLMSHCVEVTVVRQIQALEWWGRTICLLTRESGLYIYTKSCHIKVRYSETKQHAQGEFCLNTKCIFIAQQVFSQWKTCNECICTRIWFSAPSCIIIPTTSIFVIM